VKSLDTLGVAARGRAIYILGKLRNPIAVEPLIRYLRDPDPSLRRMATVALTEIGDPRVEEHFVTLLSDPDPALRIFASVGLMEIGGRIAVKLLLASLNNPDTQWLAVRILDRIGKRDLDGLILALKDERTRWYASQALIELDGQILPQLEEGLKSDDALTRENISIVLGEIRDRRAVQPLLEALQDEEQFLMTSAASLIQIGDPAAVEPLIELLSNKNEQIRLYASYALGGLRDRRAITPLVQALKDSSSSIRGIAAHALGQIGSREAAAPLRAALDDASDNVRVTAVYALGKLGDRESIPKLQDFIAVDPSYPVRKAAAEVLDTFTYQ
jgi:HEAT repeat protein